MKELLSRLRTAAIVMENLPEQPGYNGSLLTIDDMEAEEVAKALDAAVAALVNRFKSIGVIDSNGDIYPEPPEPGTQVFVETHNAEIVRMDAAGGQSERMES